MYLYDSERKVLEELWEHGPLTASELARILREKIGWNKNTTYTVIKKCVAKDLIHRTEPHFLCTAAITLEEARQGCMEDVCEKYFDNSNLELVKSMLRHDKLSKEDIQALYNIIQKEMKGK